MRTTPQLLAVGAVMLAQPDARHHAYDLSRATGIGPGQVYPILWRLFKEGWTRDGWAEPSGRRYYVLTDLGRRELAQLVADQ